VEDKRSDVEQFLKGFFEGCGVEVDIKLIDECIDDCDGLITDLGNLIKAIKNIDIH